MANKCVEKVKIGDSVEATIASTAYAVCSTDSSIASKTAVIDGFVLMTGVTVHIKFTNDNTAQSPTLDVNNTGAKAIKIGSSNVGNNEDSSWNSGSVVSLTYDGIAWVMNGVISDSCDVYICNSNGSDDAARAILGGDWRMPTLEEWNELYDNTTSEWITINGINGRRFTALNGNSIFLPASGYHDGIAIYYDYGYYWSSTYNSGGIAYQFYFNNNRVNPDNLNSCRSGSSVRPVSTTQGIDLGLPSGLKWASTNLTQDGLSESESDYGDYFAWGETKPKEDYSWSTYKFNPSGDGSTFIKYNSEDKLVVLELDSSIKAKAYYDLDANLVKIIDENGVEHIPTKSEGDSDSYIPYGEYVIRNNFNPLQCFNTLVEYISEGKNIDLCGHQINLSVSSQINLYGNIIMFNGYLCIDSIQENVNVNPLFNIIEENIEINFSKVSFYDTTNTIRLFGCNNINVGDIEINNCSFVNLRGISRIENCNVNSFKIVNSYIDGLLLQVNQGIIFRNTNISSPTIIDGCTFKNCIIGFESSFNDNTFTPTSIEPYIIRNNYFDCGILECTNDDNTFSYHLAAMVEGYSVICENNFIEKCVTYNSTNQVTTAYDFYFSCREVLFNNNIINNIIGVAVDGGRRPMTEVFKSKKTSASYSFDGRSVKSKRIVTNNVINLHPEEFNNIDLSVYDQNNLLMLNTNEEDSYDEVKLENNIFNCQNTYLGHGYFGAKSFISSGNKYYFKGNTNGYAVYNLYNDNVCNEFIVTNNEFRITENREMYVLSFVNEIKNLNISNNIIDGMNGCIIRYTDSDLKSSTQVTDICNIYDNKLYHTPIDFKRQLDPVINSNETIFERSFHPWYLNWGPSNAFSIRPKSDNYKIVFYGKANKNVSSSSIVLRAMFDCSDNYTYKITTTYESERHLDVINKTRMWIKQNGSQYQYSVDGINYIDIDTDAAEVTIDQLTPNMGINSNDNKISMLMYNTGEFRFYQGVGVNNLVNKSDLSITIEVVE